MKRILLYIIGLNLIAIGVVLNIRWDLGVAAFSSVMYSTSMIFQISLGTASIIFYLLFVFIQIILSKKITMNYILEVPLSFAFGWLTDIYDFLIPEFEFGLFLKILLFIFTMFITGLGVFLTVNSNLVLTPTDGVVKTISEVFHIVFSKVKNCFDISLLIITVILCLLYRAPFYGIGPGTLISALFLGRVIHFYESTGLNILLNKSKDKKSF